MITFSTLSPNVEDACISLMKNAPGQQAMFKFIASNPCQLTWIIAQEAGCINVPNTAKVIQQKIQSLDIGLFHYLSEEERLNRHGRIDRQHRWVLLCREYAAHLMRKPNQFGQLKGLVDKGDSQTVWLKEVIPLTPVGEIYSWGRNDRL